MDIAKKSQKFADVVSFVAASINIIISQYFFHELSLYNLVSPFGEHVTHLSQHIQDRTGVCVCVHVQRIMTQEERAAINIMFTINTDIQEHKQYCLPSITLYTTSKVTLHFCEREGHIILWRI